MQLLNVVAKNTPTLSFAFAPIISSGGHVRKRVMFYLFSLVICFLNWNSYFCLLAVQLHPIFLQGLIPHWN